MARRNDRQALLMASLLVGLTGVAFIERAALPLRDMTGALLAPAQATLHGLASSASRLTSGARDVARLNDELRTLRAANDQLAVDILKTNDLARENAQLRNLLGFAAARVDLDLRGASVIGRAIGEAPGTLVHTLKLDVGRNAGVAVGMPVANERGLIGRVYRVGASWCDVLLISDPASAVQARIERTRETGVVFGSTSGELRMRFIPQDIEGEPNVRVGDVVFTSGLSRDFPKMIPIGQVVAVDQSDVETHQEAVIHPTVDFTTLELVLVVQAEHTGEAAGGP
jgi:rod shape-determining protein MreC